VFWAPVKIAKRENFKSKKYLLQWLHNFECKYYFFLDYY